MRKRRVYQRAKYLYSFENCLRLFRSQSTSVSINQNGKFNFGVGDFAFSIWAYPLAVTFNHDLLIKDPGVTTQARINFLIAGNSNTAMGAAFFRVIFNGNQLFDLNASNTIAPNQWVHLVYSRDGIARGLSGANGNTGAYKLFVNGVLRLNPQGGVINDPNMTNTAALLLGRSLDGYLDDYIVFNQGLTDAQVAALYNSGNGAPPPESTWSSIQAYWFFNEKNGRVVNDYANTYNPGLATFQNGSLTNYTDAQVAAGGQPQSGQTAWCDHFTRNPIITL